MNIEGIKSSLEFVNKTLEEYKNELDILRTKGTEEVINKSRGYINKECNDINKYSDLMKKLEEEIKKNDKIRFEYSKLESEITSIKHGYHVVNQENEILKSTIKELDENTYNNLTSEGH